MQQQQQQQRPAVLSSFAWQVQPQSAGKTMLVICNMQTLFPEASDKTLLDRVCSLIDQAIANNWAIAVLEWADYGETLERVRQRLARYGNYFTVTTHADDGSGALLDYCHEHGLSAKLYVVCGVSINACVRRTVRGLAYSYGQPMVDVITSACGDHYAPRWDQFPEATQIRLLPSLGH
jgi:hypothetical protein